MISIGFKWFEIIWPLKQKKPTTIYQQSKQVAHTTKGGKGTVARAMNRKRTRGKVGA